MKKIFLLFILLFGCSDSSDEFEAHRIGNGLTQKGLLGNECSNGCVWSSWAVSSGAQKLTHYCDGQGCACVKVGDIYSLCTLDNSNIAEEEKQEQSTWSNDYNLYKGNRIADEAYYEASRRNTVGWCYNAVADAVERVTGPFLWGSHAYQSAEQFAASYHFFEVWNRDLRSLPAGAIVVWGKGSSRSGHISVALGNGQEASDHITSQMTYHYGGAPARVFLPK